MNGDWNVCRGEGALRSWIATRFDLLNSHLASSAHLLHTVQSSLDMSRKQESCKAMLGEEASLREQILILESNAEDFKKNYQQLVYENDAQKLKILDLKVKLTGALLLGKLDENSVINFIKKNPMGQKITEDIMELQERIARVSNKDQPIVSSISTPGVLEKKIEALEKRLQAVSSQLSLKNLRLKEVEKEGRKERQRLQHFFSDKFNKLHEALKDREELLLRSLQENAELQKSLLDGEKGWAEEEERLLTLLNEYDPSHFEPNGPGDTKVTPTDTATERRLRKQVAHLEVNLLNAKNAVKEYEISLMQMEEKMEKLRSHWNATQANYAEENQKLRRHVEVLGERTERTDTQRRYEAEGFRTDIRDLRSKLGAMAVNLEKFKMGSLKPSDILDIEEKKDKETVIQLFAGAGAEVARRLEVLDSRLKGNKRGGCGGSSSSRATSS